MVDRTPATSAPSPSGQTAARGALITFLSLSSKITVQTATIIVLARLLSPGDYGLLAMVTAVTGVGDIFRDFGLSSAAVQSPTLSRRQRDNLFWVNAGLGATLWGLVLVGAPAIAGIYGEPRLESLTRVLALTFLFNGLSTQFRAGLTRHMKFGRLAIIDVSSQIIGLAVGIIMALSGDGYWSLVGMQVAISVYTAVITAHLAGWLPGLPHREEGMGHFLRFGWNLLGTQLINYAGNNIDSVIVGRRFGAADLGFYNRAFSLLMRPLSQVRAPTTTVALPVLSRIQSDQKRFSAFLQMGQLGLGYPIAAGLALAAAASHPLIEFLLGARWIPMADLFELFAVAGIFQTLPYVGYWVYLSRGLTGQLRRFTLLEAGVKVACIVGGSYWGVKGVAVGYTLAPVLSWPLSLWWLSRITPIPVKELFHAAGRILLTALLGGITARVTVIELSEIAPLLQLAAAACALVVVYTGAAAISRPVRADFRSLASIARLVRGGKRQTKA